MTIEANQAKTITITGRLSYPAFTMAEAIKKNDKSNFKKDTDKIAPSFDILIEQDELDKILEHLRTKYIPYTLTRPNEKYDGFDARQAKKLTDLLDSGDWEDQPPFIPIKIVGEKTKPKAPTAVATIRVTGNAGQDIRLKAAVRSEDEFVLPPAEPLTKPKVVDLADTVHEIYAGCYVYVTLNLFGFKGTAPGISAGASTVVWRMDAESFSGGVSVDEDAIFAD